VSFNIWATEVEKRETITRKIIMLVRKHYTLTHHGEENYVGAVLLLPAVQAGYESLAKRLLSDFPEYRERFAYEDISQRLRSVLSDIVRGGEYSRGEVLMNGLWDRLDNPDEQKICYIPFKGVRLAASEVEIGKFCLRTMNEAAMGVVIQRMEESADRTVGSTEIKGAFKKEQANEMMESLANSVCLVVQVAADTAKADQISMRDAATLIDLLRFTVPTLHPRRHVAIGLKMVRLDCIAVTYSRSDAAMRSSRRFGLVLFTIF
jgi:hypothetical protein